MERRRDHWYFHVILIINIIFAIAVAFAIGDIVRKNQSERELDNMNHISENVIEMAKLIGNTLQSQEMVASKYAEYIESEKLSKDSAVGYLKHWQDFYTEINLVNISTERGVSLQGTNYGGRNDMDYDFSKVEIIHNLCVNQLDSSDLTTIYEGNGIKGYQFGIYQYLTIENEAHLLFFGYETNSLASVESNISSIGEGETSLVDNNGNILFGKDTTNFEVQMANKYGSEKANEIISEVQNKNNGTYELSDDRISYHITFCKVPSSDGWTYVYTRANTHMRIRDNSRTYIAVIILMAVWLLMDIVSYFLYNLKLKRALQELTKANNAKTQFISNMSHEIRTPINAVLGMDEMILRESNDETILGYAHDIKNAGKMLLGIINDILDYSKINSGKMEIIDEEYGTAELFGNLNNIISLRAKEKNLNFFMNVNKQLPKKLYGDQLRIQQIMLNILTNAVKYTREGYVDMSVDFREIDSEHINLKISVKDTGIGIKQEEMGKLFEAFERLDVKKNRTIEGTGLGMSIVTNLLNQMGSSLQVQSEYGVGSVFSFEISQKIIDAEPVGELNFSSSREGYTEESNIGAFKAPGARILAVDDTRVNLTVIRGLLKRTEMTIDTANSGIECINMASQTKYDIIFLDHRMPGMDGLETLAKLNEIGGPNSNTPVIALTANVVSGAREFYIKAGFADYLEKPVNATKLETVVRKYIAPNCDEDINNDYLEIDESKGIEFCGSSEMYSEILMDYVEDAKELEQDIIAALQKYDMSAYVVKVHALKSSSKMIGAMKFSAEAAELEAAGIKENRAYIDENTPKLIAHLRALTESINKKS